MVPGEWDTLGGLEEYMETGDSGAYGQVSPRLRPGGSHQPAARLVAVSKGRFRVRLVSGGT